MEDGRGAVEGGGRGGYERRVGREHFVWRIGEEHKTMLYLKDRPPRRVLLENDRTVKRYR